MSPGFVAFVRAKYGRNPLYRLQWELFVLNFGHSLFVCLFAFFVKSDENVLLRILSKWHFQATVSFREIVFAFVLAFDIFFIFCFCFPLPAEGAKNLSYQHKTDLRFRGSFKICFSFGCTKQSVVARAPFLCLVFRLNQVESGFIFNTCRCS